MIRMPLLSDSQRESIQRYLKKQSAAMDPTLRQIRHKAKRIDFKQMREDMKLLEQLAVVDIPKGRKKEMKAGFTIRRPNEQSVKGGFTIPKSTGEI